MSNKTDKSIYLLDSGVSCGHNRCSLICDDLFVINRSDGRDVSAMQYVSLHAKR